jgi:hypothetical protein
MATDRETRARLAHDVGKYVARIARNVAPGADVPAALVPLLVKDLYETHAGARASARFAELAAELAAPHPSLEVARASLARIDALEAEVRAREPAALREAAALARAVGDLLSKLATEGAS